MSNTFKTVLNISLSAAFLALPILPAFAGQVSYASSAQPIPLTDPHTLACRGLYAVGIPCATSGIAIGDYQPKPIHLNLDPFASNSSDSSAAKELKNTIANAKAPHDLNGTKINIVSVPESPEIYELVNGLKHPFPSLAVYYDYGYTLSMIQPITQDQLNKYPRAHLLKVKGDTKMYYLTEGGLVRQIVDPKKIMDFYGDRAEDVITISRKEFNFYPANEYVYQISPLNRDVFQIGSAGKRYLTPMAVGRLGLRADQIAPVSQAEMNSYKSLPPVID